MSKTRVLCGVCGYSAPRRTGDKVGRHYIWSEGEKYMCNGSGYTEEQTQQPPLVGRRSRTLVTSLFPKRREP